MKARPPRRLSRRSPETLVLRASLRSRTIRGKVKRRNRGRIRAVQKELGVRYLSPVQILPGLEMHKEESRGDIEGGGGKTTNQPRVLLPCAHRPRGQRGGGWKKEKRPGTADTGVRKLKSSHPLGRSQERESTGNEIAGPQGRLPENRLLYSESRRHEPESTQGRKKLRREDALNSSLSR